MKWRKRRAVCIHVRVIAQLNTLIIIIIIIARAHVPAREYRSAFYWLIEIRRRGYGGAARRLIDRAFPLH